MGFKFCWIYCPLRRRPYMTLYCSHLLSCLQFINIQDDDLLVYKEFATALGINSEDNDGITTTDISSEVEEDTVIASRVLPGAAGTLHYHSVASVVTSIKNW